MDLAIGAAIHSGDAGLTVELARAFDGTTLTACVQLLFSEALAVNGFPPDRVEALREILGPPSQPPRMARPDLKFPCR
ncbi:hypothetical protein [Nocardia sp. NRRL S-836]|uniref:hypothetical protein n=1 Tax=Nocardia sp. NRRL S-836 TaxID=1519492 RepID=UPI0006B062BF|nr:hypothetical protein [Nocardia sp. NRRL S-836]KOV84716.1 hypothetical protein ADL03_15715 [Nocardia sp. NRRL S-836]